MLEREIFYNLIWETWFNGYIKLSKQLQTHAAILDSEGLSNG